MNFTGICRALDANLNRSSEGLRVIEDLFRFVIIDEIFCGRAKKLRHELAACFVSIQSQLHLARDTQRDPGRQIQTAAEYDRQNVRAIVAANFSRITQALRVLEEFGKLAAQPLGPSSAPLLEPGEATRLEQLRYRIYEFEQAVDCALQGRAQLDQCRLCIMVEAGGSDEEFRARLKQLLVPGVMIQLRDKQAADSALVARGRLLTEQVGRCRAEAVTDSNQGQAWWIMNDRADLAAICGADGVHLGQDDLRPHQARQIIGPDKLVGVSTHNAEELQQAVDDGANYIGAGQVFSSSTKNTGKLSGLDYLRHVAQSTSIPAFAIGGISTANIDKVIETGVRRIAVAGAVTGIADPGRTVRQLIDQLKH